MDDLESDVLRTLRVFGPCSNAEVGRRLGVDSGRTYRAIQRLEAKGLIIHPKLQAWDLSLKGFKVFQDMPAKKLELFTGAE